MGRVGVGIAILVASSSCHFSLDPLPAAPQREDGGVRDAPADATIVDALIEPDTGSPMDSGAEDAAIVLCGNGQLDPEERCDDSNSDVADGCDDACRVEDGWWCGPEVPSRCQRLPDLILTSTSVAEGALARVRATLSATVPFDVTFSWSTQEGTATSPEDFLAVPTTTAAISPGGHVIHFDVFTFEDEDADAAEVLTVQLENAVGAAQESASAEIRLTDPELVGRGLVVRYRLNDAASGPGVTALDTGPLPRFNLPARNSDNGPAYTLGLGGRGVQWDRAAMDGSFRAPVPQKLLNAINGSPTMTLEAVVRYDTAAATSRVIDIGRSQFTVAALGLQPTQVQFLFLDSANVRWLKDLRSTPEPIVVTIVVDTTLDAGEERALLYVNGVSEGAPVNNPLLNSSPQIFSTDLLVIGNREDDIRSLGGEIYYAAVYSVALLPSEVVQNADVLRRTHD